MCRGLGVNGLQRVGVNGVQRVNGVRRVNVCRGQQ